MKRKAIQLAGKTIVVSLPSKWVQRHNIKKGQEIELEEKGRELIIKAEGEPEIKRVEFDTRNQSDRIIAWILSSLHKKGYDEIEIIYNKPELIKQLQQAVKDYFIGFVIINQTNTRCTIKSISKDSEEEFDTALRRAFLVTLAMGDNLIESLKDGDISSLNNILNLEKTNNQLTNFCQRMLVKKGYTNPEKTCFYYVIIWNLEKVCDDYKYICDYLLNNLPKKMSPSAEIIQLIAESNNFLREYYNLFYNYDSEKLVHISLKGYELIKQMRLSLKSKKEADGIIASILINQVTKIIDFVTSTISIMDTR